MGISTFLKRSTQPILTQLNADCLWRQMKRLSVLAHLEEDDSHAHHAVGALHSIDARPPLAPARTWQRHRGQVAMSAMATLTGMACVSEDRGALINYQISA